MQYLQYFHQNLRHLMLRILDYKKIAVHKHDSVFGHVRHININSDSEAFGLKTNFLKVSFVSQFPKET